jgi:hypothetical protein
MAREMSGVWKTFNDRRVVDVVRVFADGSERG